MDQANSPRRPPNATSKRALLQPDAVPPARGNNATERIQQPTGNTGGSNRRQNTGTGGTVAENAGGSPKSATKPPRQRVTQGSSNQPSNVENEGSMNPAKALKGQIAQEQLSEKKAGSVRGQRPKEARGEDTDKSGAPPELKPKRIRRKDKIPSSEQSIKVDDESVIREETQMKPNETPIKLDLEPAKPVLKLKNEDKPTTKSSKTQREKAKSVTFIFEENAAAAKKLEQITLKPATKTGFKELSAKDFSVILGIWSIRFCIPWIDAWHNFNFYLLREPYYWTSHEEDMNVQEIIGLSVMSVVTILLSVFTDVINFKFFIFMVLIILFISCPIAGAILNSVLVSRAYNQDFYRKYAFVSHVLFHWASAIPLVSLPVQLTCIFEQNEEMSRQAHYNWTAVLIFLEAISTYAAFWVIPGKCPTRAITLTVVWIIIGGFILAVLLLHGNFLIEFAKPEIMHSNRYLKESMKNEEQRDKGVLTTRRKKCIWFFTVLTILSITSISSSITKESLRPEEYWDKHNILSGNGMFFLGRIFGAMFMVVVLTVIRQKLPYYFRLPFLRPDVLALGLPHIVNFIALVTLLGRLASMNYKEGDVITGLIPDNKKMVVEFYNFDFRNRTVCVHSTSFRPLRVGPRQRGAREIYELNLPKIYFNVSLDPMNKIELKTEDSFAYESGSLATFIITLPFSSRYDSDIKALYRKLEIVRVNGTQKLRPRKEPQIFFMNTFYLKRSRFKWTFFVKQKKSGFHSEFLCMFRWETVVVEMPSEGHVEIEYALVNATKPEGISTTLEVENYGVYAVLLGHPRPMKPSEKKVLRMFKTYEIMKTAGPNSGHLPSNEQLQKDGVIMASMTLAGMASSGIFIGMIYLFWLDTPIMTYRTTCIGVVWVLSTMPEELLKIKKIDTGFIVITVISFLQIICTVVIFIAAAHLYTPKFNFRKRPD